MTNASKTTAEEKKKTILALVAIKPGITAKQLGLATATPYSTMTRLLREMTEAGNITASGGEKKGEAKRYAMPAKPLCKTLVPKASEAAPVKTAEPPEAVQAKFDPRLLAQYNALCDIKISDLEALKGVTAARDALAKKISAFVKPCPFCGALPHFHGGRVICKGCGLDAVFGLDDKLAIERWNRRV